MSTYKRIAAVKTTLRILKILADQRVPISGKEVAIALDESHGTIMCHLATLEDAGFVRRVGDHFELGMELALFWARKKSQLEGNLNKTRAELAELEA